MRSLVLAITCMGILASVAIAEDITPPPWPRFTDGTTFARWEFDIDSDLPVEWDNPYGDAPLVQPNPGATYDDTLGAWVLGYGGAIEIAIANRPEPLEMKEIYLQVTFKPLGDPLAGDPYPMIQAASDEEALSGAWHGAYQVPPSTFLDDGWIHEVSRIDLFPNPNAEVVKISGGIMIRELVIDTRCIPEPATAGLLAIGAIIALFNRKRKRN